jgi:retinol dehydrogenase-12
MLFTLVLGLLIITIVFFVAITEIREMARVIQFGSRNSSKNTAFELARDIPSLASKVILIIGAAGDLGRNTAIQLTCYGRPARIYIVDLPRDDDAKKILVLKITYEVYGSVPADTKAAGPPISDIRNKS